MQTETLAIVVQPSPETSYWEAGFTAHISNGRLLSVQGMGGITQPEDTVGILHKDDYTVRWPSFLWSHYTTLYLLIEHSKNATFEIDGGDKCFISEICNEVIHLSTGGNGSVMLGAYKPIIDGTVTVTPDIVRVGETHQFDIEYVVGEAGISTGGGIRIQTPYSSWTFPELFDGAIKLKSANHVKVEYTLAPYFHPMAVFGYVYCIKVVEGHLSAGDSINIRYSDGDKGIRVQTYPKLSAYFPIHLDATGTGIYYPMSYDDAPAVCVESGLPYRIRLAMPMVIGTDEVFDVKVVVLDEHYNPVFNDFSGIVGVKSDTAGIDMSYLISEEETGIVTFKNVVIDNPGMHVFTAYGDSLETSSIVVKCVKGKAPEKLYWGAIHGHTGLSDGEGDPDDYYPYGQDIGLLDFCAMSDHDWELAEHERSRLYGGFRYVQDIADIYNEPGEFVTFAGYEWMGNEGHANVYYCNEGIDNPMYVGNISIVGNGGTDSFSDLLKHYIGCSDVMIIPHTSHGFKWTAFDQSLMPVVELYSCWGPSEFKDGQPVQGAVDGLNKGFRLGFIAGADSHHGNPGNTNKPSKYHVLAWREGFAAVYASQLTREGIFHGIMTKNCYATTAERILLEFNINGHDMGTCFTVSQGEPLCFRGLAGGTTSIRQIDLICNGDIIYSSESASQIATFEYDDEMRFPPDSYFYIRITQIDNEQAWSSPIYINVEPRC